MVEGGESDGAGKRGWLSGNVFLAGAGIMALGMVAGGYLLAASAVVVGVAAPVLGLRRAVRPALPADETRG